VSLLLAHCWAVDLVDDESPGSVHGSIYLAYLDPLVCSFGLFIWSAHCNLPMMTFGDCSATTSQPRPTA